MKPHTHKAVPQMRRESAWSYCVAGGSGNPDHARAHGGRLIIDECRCGATRQSESNGGRTYFGGWQTEGTTDPRNGTWTAVGPRCGSGRSRGKTSEDDMDHFGILHEFRGGIYGLLP